MLVPRLRESRGDAEDREVHAAIDGAVDSSLSMRIKKDLLESFVDSVSADGDIDEEWQRFVAARRGAELDEINATEQLRPDETRAFVDGAFRDGAVCTGGTAITRIPSPLSRFAAGGSHRAKKSRGSID